MNLLLGIVNACHAKRQAIRSALLILVVPLICTAQYYNEHHIAPAPWQYWHDATEIVISTNVDTSFTVDVHRSDGTMVTQLTVNSLSPAVYRPNGIFRDFPRHPLNTVLDDAGMIVSGKAPFSVNVRNVASDQLGTDVFIKGNASLTSIGTPGIGIEFRVGYYRDGPLPLELPVYSIMALHDDTKVSINGVKTTVLESGQSYLFQSPIGSLVESTKPCVMNTGAFLDAPGGCGDGTFDQVPPVQVLGDRYFVVRTTGNRISEQTTIVSTEENTWLWINRFDAGGTFLSRDSVFLATAGGYHTISNGDGSTPFSVAEITSDQRIGVFSGSAQSCEVDINTSFPISSKCHGSNFIQTTKFKAYRNSDLPYFCYILLENDTADVIFNGVSLESIVGPRKMIGNTGLYMITCTSADLGRPEVITFSSSVKLQVVIIQIGGGFSMSAAFSNLIEQPIFEDPIFVGADPCPTLSAILKVRSKYSNLQWYLNGIEIPGAIDSIYVATESGNYHVTALLDCGEISESIPLSISLDSVPRDTMEMVSCGPFLWQDSLYTKDGTYTQLIQSKEGCDSLATLILEIKDPPTTTYSVSACEGYFWEIDSNYYFNSGLYRDTIAGQLGCDSIIILDLTILRPNLNETHISTCDPYLWNQTGHSYTTSGTYADTMTNRFGCDSILLLHLTIQGVKESTLQVVTCDSFFWEASGKSMTQSGKYRDTLSSHLGCDSIVTLDLTVNHSSEQIDIAETCASYFWEVTRLTYDSSGIYSVHLLNSSGCDSIRKLDLTIFEPYTYSDTVSALNEYYWPVTGETYTESGEYIKYFSSQQGCDSLHILILEIRQRGRVYIPNVFTPNGDNINDRFVIHASAEIKLIKELLIYDRWGELVFTQYDFPPNVISHGWDGTFRGQPLTPAVFTYVASWIDNEGDRQERSGDVTLMR